MHPALDKNLFLVREHVGLFKAASNYDIFDPSNGELLLSCREESLGVITKMLRFTDYKRMTPFDVRVRDPSGRPVVRVTRGVSLFLSRVRVHDGDERVLGGFQQKLFTIGGAFDVLDPDGRPMCHLKGKWTGWDFRFLAPDGGEVAHVAKKWAGLGRELFTSADNYVLEISDEVPAGAPLRGLILGAVMCIDLVLKE